MADGEDEDDKAAPGPPTEETGEQAQLSYHLKNHITEN